MAGYTCDDVLNNRTLFHFIDKNLVEGVRPTWEMEKLLTPVLWDMEKAGLRVDRGQLMKEDVKSIYKQIQLATRINELTKLEYADGPAFAYELLVAMWGLPILARTKGGGNPSFDKDALKLYLVHPEVVHNPLRYEVVKSMAALRKESTYRSLFVSGFLENADPNNLVHGRYNQVVRTGRMSCSAPNTQQFDERAKLLIHTDGPGDGFLIADYSQIEFRIIAHYIQNQDIIRAYNEDPKTDFHQWVADLCRIKRKPAKTINFAMAFGAGQRRTVAGLAGNEDVIAEVTAAVERMIAAGEIEESGRLAAHKELCAEKGEDIYLTYHQRLPTLRATSRYAENTAARRGYVYNLYGRRRHLPPKGAHKAFNTVCQGSAMDLIKRRMIATAPRYWPELKAAGITQRVNVHDAILWHGKVEALREFQQPIIDRLEEREMRLSVPLRVDHEIVTDTWGH
jgi:DNA polymerase-1